MKTRLKRQFLQITIKHHGGVCMYTHHKNRLLKKIICTSLATSVLTITGCGGSTDEPNRPPLANTGADISVDVNTEVTLSVTASDEDGSVSSYAWKQTDGPSIGATTEKQLAVTVVNTPVPKIVNLSPDFGVAGTEVIVTADSMIPSNTQLKLNGISISADDVTDSQLTFKIPAEATTGAVSLNYQEQISNSVIFEVTLNGLIAQSESGIIADELGTEVISDYILVAITEEASSNTEAVRLAALIGGTVIGKIEELDVWQIEVTAETVADLEGFIATMEAESTVRYAMIDSNITGEAVDWSADPGRPQQRERNRVEEGVALYEAKVNRSPTESQLLPFFMAIGISESGIDYDVADFDQFLESERPSNSASCVLFIILENLSTNIY